MALEEKQQVSLAPNDQSLWFETPVKKEISDIHLTNSPSPIAPIQQKETISEPIDDEIEDDDIVLAETSAIQEFMNNDKIFSPALRNEMQASHEVVIEQVDGSIETKKDDILNHPVPVQLEPIEDNRQLNSCDPLQFSTNLPTSKDTQQAFLMKLDKDHLRKMIFFQ